MPPQTVAQELLSVRFGSSTALAKTSPLLNFRFFSQFWADVIPKRSSCFSSLLPSIQQACAKDCWRGRRASMLCLSRVLPRQPQHWAIPDMGCWEGTEPCSSPPCWPCPEGHLSADSLGISSWSACSFPLPAPQATWSIHLGTDTVGTLAQHTRKLLPPKGRVGSGNSPHIWE